MTTTLKPDLKTPVRNHYYYGKLLDADHFDLETNYANAKRWLINRLVLGYGVVYGLDVLPGPAGQPYSIVVKPGLAIDKWGREIIVPQDAPYVIPSELLPPPPAAGAQQKAPPPYAPRRDSCDTHLHVVLCYHECPGAPEPVLSGDCRLTGPCVPGEIREQFRIEVREGAVPPVATRCKLIDVIHNGQLNYDVLARHVTDSHHEAPKYPGIVLANITIPDAHAPHCESKHIDISVRRIVYTNDLLFDLILCLVDDSSDTTTK